MDIMTVINEMTPEVAILTGGMLAAILGTLLFVNFIGFLITAAGYSKMFGKAGIAGWKAFIPFLNDYNHFKLAWDAKLFFPYIILFGATAILSLFNSDPMQYLAFAASIASTVMLIILQVKTAKAFGKGAGFALLMIFLPILGAPILGFGKAAYKGKQ